MNNAAWIQRLLDETFATLDFASLAAHLTDDVIFEVTPPGRLPARRQTGKEAVVAYFADLGDIVSFWKVRCYGDGERVVAVGAESFTIQRYGVTLGSEFALLFHVRDGRISRFLIIEELSQVSSREETAVTK